MPRRIDLTGKRFGKLTVVQAADSRTSPGGSKKAYWLCNCDCGCSKEIAAASLIRGVVISCGCVVKDRISQLNRTHGQTGTRLYRIWCAMKSRCNNPNFWEYRNYGGRGIRVCDEWNDDFSSFKTWASLNGYTNEMSIDRINNNLGYSPLNCRWIPKSEQSSNRRNSIYISAYNKTLSAREWSVRLGLSYSTIVYRYHQGLAPEEILSGK